MIEVTTWKMELKLVILFSLLKYTKAMRFQWF